MTEPLADNEQLVVLCCKAHAVKLHAGKRRQIEKLVSIKLKLVFLVCLYVFALTFVLRFAVSYELHAFAQRKVRKKIRTLFKVFENL